ncbi:MAG: undecaprenyl/decaprenyl-phosphate alpha-N-acetylglucosaminyl 1-phosphate transferase [Planctomycetes bacterium]|nr:undecaprenyl/decaprenyl-phosphate alpha-N-acetylglucosaminyl 1-phosphate transferase [Planctomycetota bacterium]
MNTYSVLMLLSFGITAGLTPLVAKLACRLGAIDHPGERKVHTRATPRLGGLAIFLGVLLPQFSLFILDNRIGRLFREQLSVIGAVVAATGIVFLLGVIDDIKPLRAPIKFAAQLAAASLLYHWGFRIESIAMPYFSSVKFGIMAYPVTMLWLVGITNALNFLDGIDGAAAGVAAIAAFAIANGTDPAGETTTWIFAAGIVGATLGFLLYNSHPARIFMGDSGALFLGFLLAAVSIPSTQKATAVLAMAVPIAALALPIVDTTLAVARRIARRKSVFSGDALHVHHRLLRMGINHPGAALVIYGMSAFSAMVALTLAHSQRATLLFAAVYMVLFFLVVMKSINALKLKD